MRTSAFNGKGFCIGLLIILCSFFQSLAQPSSWTARGIGGGGSMFYPTINPANDNEFYVTCDMSQLFHSTDFGNSYTQVPFTKLQVGNVSTYEFTSNNNIAYCIANDGNINYPVSTTDGGNSWNTLAGQPYNDEDLYALKADYSNPNRVIIGYYGSLYITNDGGANFTLIKNAADAGVGITAGGVFFDGNNIYIGTNEGLLFSANGGISFSTLATTGMPAGEGIFSFAGAKVGSVTRFFCITGAKADIYNGINPYDYYDFVKGVYSLDAGSNTWISKISGIDITNDFVMFVGMARNDINTVYLGGSDASTNGNLVMKTTNAGTGWTKVFNTINNQNIKTGWSGQGGDRGWGYGESCFGITVAPNNSSKVLFGDFGFVHKTNDGGANWQQAYVNPADENPANALTPKKKNYHTAGLENTSAWQVHWQDANNLFACFSDIGGIRSTDGGNSWSFDYNGHTANTMYRIATQTGGTTMFAATSGIHDMYQSTRLQDNILDNNDANGKIIYSTNNGADWLLLHQFNHPVFWITADANNANRMYASVIHYGGGSGQGGIWRSDNINLLASSTWTQLPAPPRTEGHPASIIVLNDGKVVCTFSGRRNPAGTFTASSGVFIYDPVANTWTDVSHSDMQYWTKDIIVDPSDPTQNTWYVCVFSGWGGAPNGKGGLYKTTNRGTSWTKLTGTQFDRVTSITFNPALTSQAYLTTETNGLWISNDMNAAIPTWSLVSNYIFRQPERVYFNPFSVNEIWVTSFGNGLKEGSTDVILPVKLISFTGSRENNISKLQWVAEDEDPGDIFEIERSMEGRIFTTIKTVAGNSPSANTYLYNDTVTTTALYYRLKIISVTGNYFYSNTIVLKERQNLSNELRLLQNPVTGHQLIIQSEMKEAGNLNLLVTDISGRTILRKQIVVQAGISQFNIELPASLVSGTYFLNNESEEKRMSIRFILMN